jgi:hypothetical protein
VAICFYLPNRSRFDLDCGPIGFMSTNLYEETIVEWQRIAANDMNDTVNNEELANDSNE